MPIGTTQAPRSRIKITRHSRFAAGPSVGADRDWQSMATSSQLMTVKRLTLLLFVIVLSPVELMASTVTASSPSERDVERAIRSAADGDAVIVPAGTAAWTSTLNITKGISLLGSTSTSLAVTYATGASIEVNVNTFTGSQSLHVVSTAGFHPAGSLDVMTSTGLVTVNYAGISGNDFTNCSCSGSGVINSTYKAVGQGSAVDSTIIQDSVNPRAPLISVTSSLGKSYRVSGLTFQQLATTRSTRPLVKLTGNSHSLRFDHCHFALNGYVDNQVTVAGPIYGVFDHNVMEVAGAAGNQQAFRINNGYWTDQIGHAAWAAPTGFGTGNWFFIEDNYIINRSVQTLGKFFPYAGSMDGDIGGSAVVRHNHLYDVFIGTHGTQGLARGGRAYEIYNNDFHTANLKIGTYFGTRSGPLVSHDNTFDGYKLKGIGLAAFRAFTAYRGPWDAPVPSHWDVADTSNGTFTNAANPALTGASTPTNNTGSFNYNPVSGLYDSGKVSSGSRTTLVDTTKSWAANQWQYFTVRRLSDNAYAFIQSNTSNTLTVAAGDSARVNWSSGDQYEIRRMLILLDQPGRGQCDLITGHATGRGYQDVVDAVTGKAGWPNQALEPCYSWNDIYTPTGAHITMYASVGNKGILQPGRDFYSDTPMPGYKPYTYPHPLVSVGAKAASDREKNSTTQ